MNLTPREKDKLLISVAAMVARARLARGVRLNHPEAIALISDFVVDITAKAKDDANAMLEASDVEAWISANGEIPAGACVAMNSGWGAKVATPEFRNTPDGKFAFPGFAKSATDLLAGMNVAAIASDTLSLDPGNSADFAVHYSWLPGGRYGIENLANVDQLPTKGATIFVGAPKHARGTGGPARVMAVV